MTSLRNNEWTRLSYQNEIAKNIENNKERLNSNEDPNDLYMNVVEIFTKSANEGIGMKKYNPNKRKKRRILDDDLLISLRKLRNYHRRFGDKINTK